MKRKKRSTRKRGRVGTSWLCYCGEKRHGGQTNMIFELCGQYLKKALVVQ